MSVFIPRPYQLKAVDQTWDYFNDNFGNPLIGLPTGTGKSIIPPMFMARAFSQYPDSRFLLCTHVKELITQNARAMRKIWPTAPLGVCSAGLKRWEPMCPIVYAGVGSIYKRANELGKFDIMFIDEAHLLSQDDNSMYQQLIMALKVHNPYMKVIGMTATPYRMGQGYLTDDGLFTDFSFDMTSMSEFVYFIDEGYLTNLVTPQTQNMINIDDVRQEAFDFNQRDLQRAVDKESVTKQSLEEAYELGRDRKSWMVFGAGIENCYHLSERLSAMGVSNVVVHSDRKGYKITDDERDARIAGFKAGYYKAIISYGILTTGFDHPPADFLIDLRPTTSVNLHVQKYGRVTRPYYHPDWSFEQLRHKEQRFAAMAAAGKTDALIADFAGNIGRLGPINAPRVPTKREGGSGEMPLKICEACGAANHTVARVCALCGEEFVFRTKIKPTASDETVVRREDDDIKTYTVERWFANPHTARKSGSKSMKVTYFCNNNRQFTAYLSFESKKGYAKHKAVEWWRQHCGDSIPSTVEEAIEMFQAGLCRQTTKLVVNEPENDYAKIMEYIF